MGLGPAGQERPTVGLLGIMQELYDDMPVPPSLAERQGRYAQQIARHLEGSGRRLSR